MEYIVVGAVACGFVALDEGIKCLCRSYMKHHNKKEDKSQEETL